MKFQQLLFLLLFGSFALAAQNGEKLKQQFDNEILQDFLQQKRMLKQDSTQKQAITADIAEILDAQKLSGTLHFPYPIIFVHGLASNADTWFDFYDYALSQGWSYGGHLPFCLNGDNDDAYSNTTSILTTDVYNFIGDNAPVGDFYLVNFNVDEDGTAYGNNFMTTTQSNQSAITKQGIAISEAVRKVLEATGREKVILFGHSMGGLASRQYLQNSELWQEDGEHHVAKLVTTGTPHGGSNVSGFGLADIAAGIDERADAIRDLRTSHYYSETAGVFLFGGLEDAENMNDSNDGFYNYDVNCNGESGDMVVGLNEKYLPSDLDFTCIFGSFAFGGDGVVSLQSANLKNYYNDLEAETFLVGGFHTDLTSFVQSNFEGFDEPDKAEIAYRIQKNTIYNGFITKQGAENPDNLDNDFYVFHIPQTGVGSVYIDNGVNGDLNITLFRASNGSVVLDDESEGSLGFSTNYVVLEAGEYYLRINGIGNNDSWQNPYTFGLVFNETTAVIENDFSAKISIWPNPVQNSLQISFSTLQKNDMFLQIFDVNGKIILQEKIERSQTNFEYNSSKLANGLYFVKLIDNKESQVLPFIVNH
ncbi:MAG: alpha/beta fold hydrolase [Chitinophagales bacterium]